MTTHSAFSFAPGFTSHLGAITLSLLLVLPPLAHAHGDEDHAHDDELAQPLQAASATVNSAQGGAPRRLPDGGLWMPKPVQHRLGVRTQLIRTGQHAQALELNGRVIAEPNAAGKVQASQGGRIMAGPQGLPLPGQKVSKGQVLAYLHPTTTSLERGDQLATLADLDAQYAVADRKVSRYEQLEGAIPRKDLDAARQERDALRQRRAAIGAGLNAPEALRAPTSGTVTSARVSIGQVVDAKDVLFEVVDPARLMVEALAYAPAQTQGIGKASATLPDGQTLPLQHVGGGLQMQEQAMPLLFSITRQPGGPALAIGQPVQVTAATSLVRKGMAVPRSALVRNAAGDTVVWLHTAAEQFSPRVVRFEPLDGTSVLVTSGLKDGERVVTQGASLLAQVR